MSDIFCGTERKKNLSIKDLVNINSGKLAKISFAGLARFRDAIFPRKYIVLGFENPNGWV